MARPLAALALVLLPVLAACAAAPVPYEVRSRDDVTVTRDAWGVPTISGADDAAIAYGIAVAQAEDDFGTVQRQALAVRRRLGRFDGKEGAALDFLSRVMRVQEVVAAEYETQLPAEDRAVMEAYADGLNAYAAAHPDEVLDRTLFPVTGRDIVGGIALKAPLFFGLGGIIGALAGGEDLPLNPGTYERGSNAYAVSGRRSPDGVTRLVSNSHQPWTGPVAWYELQVESEEGWRFRGVNFPGVPFPLMGHNEHLGYTNTVNRPDLIDVYELETDGDRYFHDGAWRELERERIVLRVKIGPLAVPVPRTLWRSVHGPVFRSGRGDFAVRWPQMDHISHSVAYRALAKAEDFGAFQDALRLQLIPSTNFIYADKEGNIGHFYNASLPARAPGPDYWDVLPGDDPALVWDSLAPWDAIPKNVNPPAGWLMNANNTPYLATAPEDDLDPGDFAPELGIEPYLTNRALRSVALLDAVDGPISREALMAVKWDRAYDPASLPVKLLENVAAVQSDDPLTAEAAALLETWDRVADGVGAADSLAALVLKANRPAAYGAMPPPDPEETLSEAARYLTKHHGRLDVPLPDILRLRRGDTDLPLTGGYDALRAVGWENGEDGILRADFGDSFVMLVEWHPDGTVTSSSVQPFGSAIERPQSPHYDDQAPLFADETLKPTGF